MKLAIIVPATESYLYAHKTQTRAIQQNIASIDCETLYIFVSDKEREDIGERVKKAIAGEYAHLTGVFKEGENYKTEAQLTIASMFSAGISHAIKWGADFTWLVEADVIPHHNNLRSMIDILSFDGGYYSIAFSPYISQGGGGLLGGYGDLARPIFQDVLFEERDIPKGLAERMREHLKDKKRDEAWFKEKGEIEKEGEKYPPKGNLFTLQGKGFKRRGWGNMAMPQSGKGMVWEVDWIGTGNTLLNRKALLCSDFTGYSGAGTQDLFLCFHKWEPNNCKIACLPHSPSDHVIRKPYMKDGKEVTKYTLLSMYHETMDRECRGHLRHREEPFYDY